MNPSNLSGNMLGSLVKRSACLALIPIIRATRSHTGANPNSNIDSFASLCGTKLNNHRVVQNTNLTYAAKAANKFHRGQTNSRFKIQHEVKLWPLKRVQYAN